ncbi:MAG: extracellular solute-binding protein [Acetatifactor sp.]|nr:extracellular solute-binding protein [Acetatifactor sp.]
MKCKKISALLLASAMVVGLLSGCGSASDSSTSVADDSTAKSSAPAQTEADENISANEVTLPLCEEKTTLKLFIPLDGNMATITSDYNENKFFQELEKRTNVHIEFMCPAIGEEPTAYNLMIASDELPDIIAHNGYHYADGLDAAVDDGYYLDLTPYLDTYLSNYNKLRLKSDFFAKSTVTDKGRVVGFYQIFSEPQPPYKGLQIRKDWLDDLGLDVPVTFDDWEEMLVAFRDKKNAYSPLSIGSLGYNMDSNSMSAGYNVLNGFMNVNGTVKYGPIEDGWRKYLTKMNDWYNKKLIDPDFMTGGGYMPDMSIITSGQCGAWDSMYTMPALYEASSDDKNMQIIPVASPVENVGDEVHVRLADSIIHAYCTISADSENAELAMKWLDYMCTEEGSLLANYGVEHESFEFDSNGKPQFTELVTNNPDGYSFAQCMTYYALPPSLIGGDYDWTRELSSVPEEDVVSMDVWGAVSDDYNMPAGISYTSDEAKELGEIVNNINTYITEKTSQFITGVADINTEWDTYVNDIKAMNVDRAIEINQAALDRFNNR